MYWQYSGDGQFLMELLQTNTLSLQLQVTDVIAVLVSVQFQDHLVSGLVLFLLFAEMHVIHFST